MVWGWDSYPENCCYPTDITAMKGRGKEGSLCPALPHYLPSHLKQGIQLRGLGPLPAPLDPVNLIGGQRTSLTHSTP